MSCSKFKSNYKRWISLSGKKETANALNHYTWGMQGLWSPCTRNQVAVILDTRELLTLRTLLEKYHSRFKTIYIVQWDANEHAAIAHRLDKLKNLLDRRDYPAVELKKGDVFNFLSNYDEKIDYVWLDFEQAVLNKEQMLTIASKSRDLKCLTITLSARAHIKGRGRSVKNRIAAMQKMFEQHLPFRPLNFPYDAGGGPMRLIAFGKLDRGLVTKESLKIAGLFDYGAQENELDVD